METQLTGILRSGSRKENRPAHRLADVGLGLFEKHQQPIRGFLKPAKRFEETGEKFIADLARRYETLIGVQIRQTDYRYWENGKYFFTAEQYRGFIQQLQQRFGPRRFRVAADEVQPPDLLQGLPAAFRERRDGTERTLHGIFFGAFTLRRRRHTAKYFFGMGRVLWGQADHRDSIGE